MSRGLSKPNVHYFPYIEASSMIQLHFSCIYDEISHGVRRKGCQSIQQRTHYTSSWACKRESTDRLRALGRIRLTISYPFWSTFQSLWFKRKPRAGSAFSANAMIKESPSRGQARTKQLLIYLFLKSHLVWWYGSKDESSAGKDDNKRHSLILLK